MGAVTKKAQGQFHDGGAERRRGSTSGVVCEDFPHLVPGAAELSGNRVIAAAFGGEAKDISDDGRLSGLRRRSGHLQTSPHPAIYFARRNVGEDSIKRQRSNGLRWNAPVGAFQIYLLYASPMLRAPEISRCCAPTVTFAQRVRTRVRRSSAKS
jgi:hypothetical protein